MKFQSWMEVPLNQYCLVSIDLALRLKPNTPVYSLYPVFAAAAAACDNDLLEEAILALQVPLNQYVNFIMLMIALGFNLREKYFFRLYFFTSPLGRGFFFQFSLLMGLFKILKMNADGAALQGIVEGWLALDKEAKKLSLNRHIGEMSVVSHICVAHFLYSIKKKNVLR
ncbi:hypothetical protein ACJX0J_018593 [Zea mays]